MNIIPIAFDSMGARSMATYVETSDVRILIDPSVSLGPSRYGLPPHQLEIERMNQLWEKIKKFAEKSDVIIITHYHYDHHNPNEVEIFEGKKLLLKHPTEKINRSQMGRAEYFLEQLKKVDVDVDFCDGKSYEFGNTRIEISQPVFHGVNERLGFVVEVYIEEKGGFLFSSDVEGPIHDEQLRFMIEKNPEIVFLDGPMTYMLGYRYSQKSFRNSIENLKRIVESTDVKYLIPDHHLTRDLKWREKLSEVFVEAEDRGVKIMSAANYGGVNEELLEARRKELYGKA